MSRIIKELLKAAQSSSLISSHRTSDFSSDLSEAEKNKTQQINILSNYRSPVLRSLENRNRSRLIAFCVGVSVFVLAVKNHPALERSASHSGYFGLKKKFYPHSENSDSPTDLILAQENKKAVELYYTGHLDEAKSAFSKLVDAHPRNASLLINLSQVELTQKHWKEAEASVFHALKLAPNHPGALAIFGKIMIEKGEYAVAENVLQKGLAEKPNSSELLLTLGELAELSGNWIDALSFYGKYIASNEASSYVKEILMQRIPKITMLSQAASHAADHAREDSDQDNLIRRPAKEGVN